MKNVYVISIINSAGTMISLTILAPTLAAAVAKAQEVAGVTHEQETSQRLATVDYEVTE